MEDKYADLTKWTPACYKRFKEIPFLQIRQNPNAYYTYNPNHPNSKKDALHSTSRLDGTFLGWEVRRTGLVSKNGKKLKDRNLKFYLGGGRDTSRYWELLFCNKHYKLHQLIRYTYPNLIHNGHNIKDFPIVDHFDGNKLNNDIKNIRGANISLNNQNKVKRGQIDYIGVSVRTSLLTSGKNYYARISVGGKQRGKYFLTQKEAAIHYDLLATEFHYIKNGNIPKLNFPENLEQYASEIKNKGQLELAIGI